MTTTKPPTPAASDMQARLYHADPRSIVWEMGSKLVFTLEVGRSFYERNRDYFSAGPNVGSLDWQLGEEIWSHNPSPRIRISFENPASMDGITQMRVRYVNGWGETGDWSEYVPIEVVGPIRTRRRPS